MAKLAWGETGTRVFETGVDRGVLYPPISAVGVPWNGLISVKESPGGGELQSYYQDGQKYFQITTGEDFKANIQAFSAPPEFAACDGIMSIHPGLQITQQPRKQFSFTYRTLVGNEVKAENYGYKLHLVYNALAKPTGRDRATLSSSTEPMDLSWDVETVPPPYATLSGFKPAAHIVINSLLSTAPHLTAVENILYGQDSGANPRMPTLQELITIFGS